MHAPSLVVDTAQQLAAAGQHAEVVKYLGGRGSSELENSASLALLYGTAQARLGRHAEGQRWLDLALEHARRQRDDAVERRALNARGAAAFVSGRIDEAVNYFTQASMRPSRDGDFVMTGRCSNNLGILSNLRGRYAEAIGSWEIAIAAFERAGGRQGVAECYHNLAITYRLQGMPDRALAQADRAVGEAEAAGDETLRALALRGRAEIRALRGELELARRDLAQVRQIRGCLADPVGAAEDLRIVALVGAAEGDVPAAQRALRDVIGRAEQHGRPQLLAEATRDLAVVLRRSGGAVALERGGIDEASYFFTRAQEEAMQDNDMATVGRCANNLGVIANMQGDYARAVGAYTRAIAAYEQARYHRGIAESRHNLGITYREQGRLDHALQAADAAVRDAEWLDDRGFKAQALAGRAEIRLAQGEPELAVREAEEALAIHREVNDAVRETEDLRILAGALSLAGKTRDAEDRLRAVIARAMEHDRPLLVATAQRDLASVLYRTGDRTAAMAMARAARATFDRLGAKAEAAKLDALETTLQVAPQGHTIPSAWRAQP